MHFKTRLKTMAAVGALALATGVPGIAAPAAAAVIHTLSDGTARPIPKRQSPILNAPITFADGVTYQATTLAGAQTSSSFGGTGNYSFPGSAPWSGTPFAAFGLQNAIMSFTFADPVSAVLAEFNWSQAESSPPLLFRIFNSAGDLLESFTFSASDPSHPIGYYGFERAGNDIGRFEVEGYWVGARNLSTATASVSAVPEPASWALMIGGLGLIGGAMRRRRVAVSFA